jgi:hypothetical protein
MDERLQVREIFLWKINFHIFHRFRLMIHLRIIYLANEPWHLFIVYLMFYVFSCKTLNFNCCFSRPGRSIVL